MSDSKPFPDRRRASTSQAIKTCPWCAGALQFDGSFPVVRLVPGDTRLATREQDIPEPLRTIPAWVCQTPHCKYREIA
jgi:hypothetical protein